MSVYNWEVEAEDIFGTFPKGAGRQEPKSEVQVLMNEDTARLFERECLRPRRMELTGPLLFSDDDLPTYIIGVEAP
jgi:hypothetical protein